jgi:aspartyl-tRNA(Asn)/glutamyl-tRNA(Gln) amidotransferase subunit C
MNIKDVENLASLARIELEEDEKKDLLQDMDSILEYVKQIEEMKVEDTESESQIYNVWREDEVIPREFSKELIVGQFPNTQDGFLKVKKIL